MNKHHSQLGGTLVEAAVVLLVLFTFLLGTIDLGRAYNVYQTMTAAAREGARFAVSPCSLLDSTGCTYGAGSLPTTAAVQAKVQSYLDVAAVKATTIQVDPAYQEDPTSTIFFTKITVSEPYTFFFLPWSVTMHTQAVMRNENN
jgi:Flp pilus assembly protein TadG